MAKVTVQDSKGFSLNRNDIVVLVKNAGLMALAAGLTFIGENVSQIDLGMYGPLVVPVVAVVIDTAVKWARNNVTE
jgi:hypothetical protein